MTTVTGATHFRDNVTLELLSTELLSLSRARDWARWSIASVASESTAWIMLRPIRKIDVIAQGDQQVLAFD